MQSSPAQAESILETYLQAQVGETVAGVLADPLPWPDFPPETQPLPQPRTIPKPLPDAANDPDFFPEKWRWKILSRVGVIVCGPLICSADGESDEWITWREIGWEWAIQDLIEHEIDEQQQPKVVIGEGEGRQANGQYLFNRIPNAAQAYGAIYFSPGSFTIGEWSHATDVALWFMNYGWITSMMGKQATLGCMAPGLREVYSILVNDTPWRAIRCRSASSGTLAVIPMELARSMTRGRCK